MYTNHKNFGGDFKAVLQAEFSNTEDVIVAAGYASLDVLRHFENDFIKVAKSGGSARLLLGMALYEGLSQPKLDFLQKLCKELNQAGKNCGVFVTWERKYHGKVYYFKTGIKEQLYVGSSNFSSSGTSGNIECTIEVKDHVEKKSIKSFLDHLFTKESAISILKADIVVPGSTKYKKRVASDALDSLQRYDTRTIDLSKQPYFVFPLDRVAEKEKSSLNVYFGKGRWNRSNGTVTPRPWYEVELIADKKLTSNSLYPQGDFFAYTDDGYIIPMRTQGDYYKNIRSKKSLQIFGMWLKGKLQKAGALVPLTPVTNDTLAQYGNDKIVFYKLSKDKYYISF